MFNLLANMNFSKNIYSLILLYSIFAGLLADKHVHSNSIQCLLKVNESYSCENTKEYQSELSYLFDNIPRELKKKLVFGSLIDLNIEEIVTLPENLLFFIPINKLTNLKGSHLALILHAHKDNSLIAKKILQSLLTHEQRIDFLNTLTQKSIVSEKVLNTIGEIVYKWNIEGRDGKLHKLTNICVLPRLWPPFILTRSRNMSERLLHNLDLNENREHRERCNIIYNRWKNLPKYIRRLWSFLAINNSLPIPLEEWTNHLINQYKLIVLGLRNDEIRRLKLIDTSETRESLKDIEFDHLQTRFLFDIIMKNNSLRDILLHYPLIVFKLSPMQFDEFDDKEWADVKETIPSPSSNYFSYPVAKQIFNKIANHHWLTAVNATTGWSPDDLRHLPLLYTQPPSTFKKFCFSPPSAQSIIALDSSMISSRQAFYISGCSSMLSFNKNNQKLLLNLNHNMLKAFPVSSLIFVNLGYVTHEILCHLVTKMDNTNLPMALRLVDIIKPAEKIYYVEEMLKNKHNILFDQLSPKSIFGPIFDSLNNLYSNYSERIDKLPKNLLRSILENNELLQKWSNKHGLYEGFTCNYIEKLNGIEFLSLLYKFNTYLNCNGKTFPKSLQPCVAKVFMKYLRLKSVLSTDKPSPLFLEEWEIEAVQGFILTTLPIEIIVNSDLKHTIMYSIGKLSYAELLIAAPTSKITNLVQKYLEKTLKNSSNISFEQLYILGNLTHFLTTTNLERVEGKAFKFLIEAGLFDSRICFSTAAKDYWANLIIRSFGNPKTWLSDTLQILSDALIVLNQDQLDSIPILSRLNSADIISTRYADVIEWLPIDIPFYKACSLIQNNQEFEFTNSLSILIDFYLDSIQNQLNMISPIINDQQTETVITSPELKLKNYASEVKILIPFQSNNEDTGIFDLSKTLFDRFSTIFSGKVEPNSNNSSNKTENIPVSNYSISMTEDSKSRDLNTTDSTNIATSSTQKTNTTPKNYDLYNAYGSKNLQDNETTNTDSVSVIPLIENSKQPTLYEDTLASTTIGIPTTTKKPLNFKNTTDENLYSTTIDLNVNTNIEKSIPSTIKSTFNGTKNSRIKRSYTYFFSHTRNITCDTLRILGPASIISKSFDSIIEKMSDEELTECVDFLGSLELKQNLTNNIWYRIKDKTAIHTYGSVISGLSIDELQSLNLDIKNPWTLEIINLLGNHIKNMTVRKEITRQFLSKLEENINKMNHLWGSFGSLICQLPQQTVQIMMHTSDLFWETSTAFKSILMCDDMCVKNLALIAISRIGESKFWSASEIERMGVIIAGINTTQWKSLLDYNSNALEGITPNAVECLSKSHIELMDETHLKYLTPQAAYVVLNIHSEILDKVRVDTLTKIINFEIDASWQPVPSATYPKLKKGQIPGLSSSMFFEMPSESNANTINNTKLLLSFSCFVLLFIFI
ncbi:uncharacterized protein LOC126898698 [Daktulosphaira vitifoliae]|uniref:uncharacterized protein LOC126898698 n=1 Tax=Daktulosphaira vitifoliae TaxID=58002 RepID=UPI0021AAFA88|nr:uncharacterized protein LOC126898698 [Daktulosphaira vitifoliae]